MTEPLRMTFDPMTIEHLGVRMYSTLPPVLGELIANSYDADASHVRILLSDTGDKEITIEDDGHGMSFDEINTKFLRIGRNRRTDATSQITHKGRKVIGKKGLGKLSFFGIAHEIAVVTKKGGRKTSFVLDWEDIKRAAGAAAGMSDYRPRITQRDIPCDGADGTTITLRRIQRASAFDPDSLANSIARIFICDPSFAITLVHNGSMPLAVSDDRRYANLSKQIEWQFPPGLMVESDFPKKDEITGVVFTADKPISPRTNMRGITLFSRRKLVNAPEYFSDTASSHFFSYLTGWLMVDFIDDLEEDVIGTNRQSLNWDHPEMAALRGHLQKLMRSLELDWRERRKKKRREDIGKKSQVDVAKWFETLPADIEKEVTTIISSVVDDSELEGEDQSAVVTALHHLVPEYPRYHWRHLHPEIQAASSADYQNQDYYRAFQEAAKRFITLTRQKSGSTNTSDQSLMGEVYGKGNKLTVTRPYKKPDGKDFPATTLENIEDGQKFLSMGIVAGGRNPVAHEEIAHLRDSGLFREKDCLDGLSLLSHLIRRLDDA